jgi:putative phosphoribosyl transferase
MPNPVFRDRREAGRVLAGALSAYANRPDVLVLALPRGGVPVGFEVAEALHVPLDVFIVRKLGVPWRDEFAMGAIASGGVRVLNQNAAETCEDLRLEADEVVCATTPEPFRAVGQWYEDFSQTSDEEVHDLLERARHGAAHEA